MRGLCCRACMSGRCEAVLLPSNRCAPCRIYDLYCDYVLKNPFYEVEMPIRCEMFDSNLFQTINSVHKRWGLFS